MTTKITLDSVTLTLDANELEVIRKAVDQLHDNSDDDEEMSRCRSMLKSMPKVVVKKEIKR